MIKKIVGLIICILFLLPVLSSTGVSISGDDVEIKIYTNRSGLDIGAFLIYHMINNKPENITVYKTYKSNYLFRNIFDGEWTNNFTVESNSEQQIWVGKNLLGWGIEFFTITLECEDVSVTRNGVWIGINIIILFN